LIAVKSFAGLAFQSLPVGKADRFDSKAQVDRMPHLESAIYVVDDDSAVRATLTAILTRAGYLVICFADGEALLEVARRRAPVCILLDVYLDGPSGITILKHLNANGEYPAPVFVMSGRGNIQLAVEAIKHGAFDFIEKPFRGHHLIEKIKAATGTPNIRNTRSVREIEQPLSKRETEILTLLTEGHSNKEIAQVFDISPRTVEYHRSRLLKKMNARNVVDLMQATYYIE
jgi:FixJ family two-component response regulator